MATIKDVAKVAGVSHGTVSNVLRGDKRVSLQNIKAVEKAIEELGYIPTAAASSLKTNNNKKIAVIIPNIEDPYFVQIYKGVEQGIVENGYICSIYTTNDIAIQEINLLNQLISEKVAGIILVTCQPFNKAYFNNIEKIGIPIVFIDRKPKIKNYNYIYDMDNQTIKSKIKEHIQNGCSKFGLVVGSLDFSNEEDFRDIVRDEIEKYAKQEVELIWIKESNMTKENAFKIGMYSFLGGTIPEVIICSSTLISYGILEAIKYHYNDHENSPRIIALAEDIWMSNASPIITKIARPAFKIGVKAGKVLIGNISDKVFYDTVVEGIRNDVISKFEPVLSYADTDNLVIRAIFLKSEASFATYSMIKDFEKKTGIQVKVEFMSYTEMYDTIMDDEKRRLFDVIQIDMPWIPAMVENKYIIKLDNQINGYLDSTMEFANEIIHKYGKYKGHIYAMPYMYGIQLLYYRKDLFEDIKLKRQFYETYKTELRVPKNWNEYNAVAKFFTKEYNKESPTQFGTTLGGSFWSGAICEYLPRQKAFNAYTFGEKDNFLLTSMENVRALENYKESFKYAHPDSKNFWWDEQVEEFINGRAAMMILFMSHVTDLINTSKSQVVGKIGFDTVPGGNPLLGGWSLAVVKGSSKQNEAFEFIKWATSSENAIPYTLLGGSTTCINQYNNPELATMYPWLPKSLEDFKIGYHRELPKWIPQDILPEYRYEEIVGEAVHHAISGTESVKSALEKAEEKLRNILKQ